MPVSPDAVADYFELLCLRSRRKDQKKVTKLEAQIPYHEGRGNVEEVAKIKEQIGAIKSKLQAM